MMRHPPRENADFLKKIERIETLASELDRAADPLAGSARELARAMLELHKAGLSRIFERLRAAGEPGHELVAALAADELVGALLVLYDLHPASLAERVGAELDRLRSQGCDSELLEIDGSVVRLRLRNESWLPVGAMQALIEQALTQAVPDVSTIEFEGSAGSTSDEPDGYFPLPIIGGLPFVGPACRAGPAQPAAANETRGMRPDERSTHARPQTAGEVPPGRRDLPGLVQDRMHP